MLLFNRKKKVLNSLLSYLNEADDNYMLMFQYKDISYFQNYCVEELAIKLNDILANNPDYQTGIAKYRHRSWTVMEHEGFFYAYQKDTTHDNITIRGTLAIPLGDELHEIWKIQELSPNEYIVVDIIKQKEFSL